MAFPIYGAGMPSASGDMVCRSCGRVFSGGLQVCPFDGTQLRAITRPQSEGPLVGAVLGGSYTILEKLGSGGMGDVYRARQNRLQRDVAVKVLAAHVGATAGAAERLRAEALAISQLKCPHTVTVYDFGATDEGLLYLVMQLVDGESLRRRLERGPLSLRSAVTIAIHIAESLAEAHDRHPQIIHRDIKPDNVLVSRTADGEEFATVLDFGLARFASSEGLTIDDTIAGTPAYMAPELVRNNASPDPRVDLYALGAVIHEMIAGQAPFVAESGHAVLYMHIWNAPAPLSQLRPDLSIPPALERLVLDLLEKAPEARPASAIAVRARLLEILERLSHERRARVPAPTVVHEAPVEPAVALERTPAALESSSGATDDSPTQLIDLPAVLQSRMTPPELTDPAQGPELGGALSQDGFSSDGTRTRRRRRVLAASLVFVALVGLGVAVFGRLGATASGEPAVHPIVAAVPAPAESHALPARPQPTQAEPVIAREPAEKLPPQAPKPSAARKEFTLVPDSPARAKRSKASHSSDFRLVPE
jgi:serine/threonine-protein kinase